MVCPFLGMQGSQAHMLSLPLFYPYQLAMAQAAAGKNVTQNMAADMQRAAELQRQYLLDMIPPQSGQRHNWKAWCADS